MPRDRVAHRRELPGFADVDDKARELERVLQLRQRGRKRSVGIGTRNREERTPGGEQGEAFGRREPQWTTEVLREPDRDVAVLVVFDVEVVARRVRRHADHQHEREVVIQLLDRDTEA